MINKNHLSLWLASYCLKKVCWVATVRHFALHWTVCLFAIYCDICCTTTGNLFLVLKKCIVTFTFLSLFQIMIIIINMWGNKRIKSKLVWNCSILNADDLKEQLEDVNQDIHTLDDQVRMCCNLSALIFEVCIYVTSNLKKIMHFYCVSNSRKYPT